MTVTRTYGIGGYIAEHPSGNVVDELVDHGDGTGTRTFYAADGSVASTETVSGLPPAGPPYPPLDATGALATLLVVEGVIGLQDAANALHEEPAHLEHEAQAWAL
jgi:hypothetical protein